MNKSMLFAGLVVLACVLAPAAAQESQPSADPQEVGLVERAERRLAQLDVTVTGPMPDVAELTKEDFELVVSGKNLSEFLVDQICRVPEEVPTVGAVPQPEGEPTEPAREQAAYVSTRTLPATFLFFFDQQHLTSYGRQQALEIARTLIPRLVAGGNRAMVVSNGVELATFSDLTGDVDELLDALEQVEGDRRQWDAFAQLEEQRVSEVVGALRASGDASTDLDHAKSLARIYQREEQFRTGSALRRFSTVVARLADLDPPKAIVYFADTMRSNAGAHYTSFFSRNEAGLDAVLDGMAVDAIASRNPFDRVLDEAAAHGVRIYTIQAQGLVTESTVAMLGSGRPNSGSLSRGNNQRIRDAQNALASMAAETGAQSFLNGVKPTAIAEAIAKDLECLYLVSFDAGGFREDETLRVRLQVKRPGVRARVRGQIRLMSDESRTTSRLLAAFSAPDTVRSDLQVVGRVVPAGYEDGRYRALLQISVPGSALTNASWDIGASIVSGGRVKDEASGRISVRAPNVPIVFETELRFPPGPFDVMMVAHETNTDSIATGKLTGEWPDPDEAQVTVGPLAVLQPTTAAFLRDGRLRTSGGLALDEESGLRHDAETMLIGIVCRGRRKTKKLELRRVLVGDTSAEFKPTDLEFQGQRCAQFRDVVPAKTMTEGTFVYEVRVQKGKDEIASRDFSIRVAEPPTDSSAAPASGGLDETASVASGTMPRP